MHPWPVISDVPQRIILAPLLLLCYILIYYIHQSCVTLDYMLIMVCYIPCTIDTVTDCINLLQDLNSYMPWVL